MKLIDDIAIDVPNASAGDRAHCQFLMAGNTKLPYDENVDRQSKLFANLACNRYASSRQRQDNGVDLIQIFCELRRKDSTCVGSVPENHVF